MLSQNLATLPLHHETSSCAPAPLPLEPMGLCRAFSPNMIEGQDETSFGRYETHIPAPLPSLGKEDSSRQDSFGRQQKGAFSSIATTAAGSSLPGTAQHTQFVPNTHTPRPVPESKFFSFAPSTYQCTGHPCVIGNALVSYLRVSLGCEVSVKADKFTFKAETRGDAVSPFGSCTLKAKFYRSNTRNPLRFSIELTRWSGDAVSFNALARYISSYLRAQHALEETRVSTPSTLSTCGEVDFFDSFVSEELLADGCTLEDAGDMIEMSKSNEKTLREETAFLLSAMSRSERGRETARACASVIDVEKLAEEFSMPELLRM